MSEIDNFLKYIHSFDIEIEITDGKYLYDAGGKISGYFDPDTNKIKVAGGQPTKKWLPVLVHEFCHYQQKINKYPLFYAEVAGEDVYDIFNSWLSKSKDYSDQTLNKAVRNIILIEKDCEIRATKLIKRFDLPIDLVNYIQQANRYLYQYYVALDYQKWIIEIPDSKKDWVTKQMPTHFRNKHHISIPENIYQIIEKGYGYN